MDTQSRAEFIERMRQKPDEALSMWLHGLKGSVGAITSAALVMQEIVAAQGANADPILVEMVEIILERTEYVLGITEVFRQYYRTDMRGEG